MGNLDKVNEHKSDSLGFINLREILLEHKFSSPTGFRGVGNANVIILQFNRCGKEFGFFVWFFADSDSGNLVSPKFVSMHKFPGDFLREVWTAAREVLICDIVNFYNLTPCVNLFHHPIKRRRIEFATHILIQRSLQQTQAAMIFFVTRRK